jgi:hypothetical protein
MVSLARTAATKHWGIGSFAYFAAKTDWYAHIFRGIEGTGMSEGQYLSAVRTYQELGNRIGEHVDQLQAAWLISHRVSTGEFQDRVLAIQKIDNNSHTMEAFVQTLKARGIIKWDANVKKEDLYNFALRRGPDAWNGVWDEAQTRMAAAQAGFIVGHNITREQIIGIAHQLQGPTPMSIGEITTDYTKLARSRPRRQPRQRRSRRGSRTRWHPRRSRSWFRQPTGPSCSVDSRD